ncbi:SdpI family protein [Paenibacillus psychroresistens]|uniref:SdpI family protein n=1 Tax=Paenibacillus psychroresistens TaxID=1778678 RepID=A0A6B8RU34_9BACL|nr:SdpI family protein [Paenibacillus psychroresistens]QGQ99302.1 SdpI family protein [Paenibacillus psychroresistens]
MKNKLKFNIWDILILLLGVIPIIVAIKLLPDQVARYSNMGGYGLPIGYMNKKYIIVGIGCFTLLLPFIVKLFPLMDPKRANYLKFQSTFEYIRFLPSVVLSVICCIWVLIVTGHPFDLRTWFIVMFGICSILTGNVMGRVRTSYLGGLPTPWALRDENNWRLTHRFAGFLWILTGFLALASLFFTNSILVVIITLAIQILIPFGYSYLIHKRKDDSVEII